MNDNILISAGIIILLKLIDPKKTRTCVAFQWSQTAKIKIKIINHWEVSLKISISSISSSYAEGHKDLSCLWQTPVQFLFKLYTKNKSAMNTFLGVCLRILSKLYLILKKFLKISGTFFSHMICWWLLLLKELLKLLKTKVKQYN